MFKNLVIRLGLFFVALSMGLFAGWLNFAAHPPILQKSKPTVPQNHFVESAPVKKEFEAEFWDLPNLVGREFIASRHGNLIDVFEAGGIYRESEVIAKTGESWLTLIERDGKYKVESANAFVEKLRSKSFYGEEFEVRLTFNRPGNPIFAVKNMDGVSEGPVVTVYHRPSFDEINRRNLPIGSMEEGYRREFRLGDRWYVLRVSKGATRDGTKVGVLVLEHDGFLQVIKQASHADLDEAIVGRLLWTGDLDGDGELDLYFDEFNEKGSFAVGLYLSTAAEPGKLVKIVASFKMGGC